MNIYESIRMNLGERSYDITVGSGLLAECERFMDLDRRVAIVTDSGVPREYAEAIAKKAKTAKIITFPEGEPSKNLATFEYICRQMLEFGMQRKDAVVAVGGGVTGDMAGFAASCYMRGVDFYNVPTTLLSQVDSSVGGKTAIDFLGVKNILGAFYQPKAVLIDTDTLKTLPSEHIRAGMAEIIKMAMTSDKELFERIERGERELSALITDAIKIKKNVVEIDEREGSLRRILNFGHTFGHGIEALGGRLHGECVALGMLPMCEGEARERLVGVLRAVELPTKFDGDSQLALSYAKSDKKGDNDEVFAITVSVIGHANIEKMTFAEIGRRAGEYFK